ncbi:hypothetical protein JMM51_13235 [Rhodovulum sulfidophilum]|nr:hypothetical protein [Rhodovulum sulfidophilum]
MVNLQALISIFQLSASFCLIVGAFSSYRRAHERTIENSLDVARSQMTTVILPRQDQLEPLEIRNNLQVPKLKDLSNRELHRYLGDVTIRFYGRRFKFAATDRFIDRALVIVGLSSIAGLIVSSRFPGAMVSDWVFYGISIVSLGLPIASFLKVSFEVKRHDHYFNRSVDKEYSKKIQSKHEGRIRSLPSRGEIFSVANEIRVRKNNLTKDTKKDNAHPG